jgi:hypothetical protein
MAPSKALPACPPNVLNSHPGSADVRVLHVPAHIFPVAPSSATPAGGGGSSFGSGSLEALLAYVTCYTPSVFMKFKS